MAVYFYKTEEKYGCFSNFSHHSFVIDGIVWKTSEHYFQAQKFLDERIQNKIFSASNPMIAARLGRNHDFPLREDWEFIKDDVMRKAVYEKFYQNEDIKQILLSTGSEELIENTANDYYWGCGTNKTGKNMLGKILMETREKLRNDK